MVALLLLVGACRGAPPPDPTATAAPPTAPATPPAPTPERRPTEPAKADPFPRATTTVAETGAVLWAPWPMEGRDLGRTNRSPIVGPRAGALLWSVEIDPPSFGQVVQAADGTLYVGTETGKLQAIDRDGVRWSFETAGPIPTPAIGPDGTIYTRGGDGALYAIRADGRRRWTTDIGAEPRRLGPAPLIGPDDYYPGEARMDRLQSGADPHQADRTWEGTRCHRWATWATSWKSISPPERSRPPS